MMTSTQFVQAAVTVNIKALYRITVVALIWLHDQQYF